MSIENYTKQALDSTTPGNSGASKIGVSAITGLLGGVATNVQAAIAELVSSKADSGRALPTGGGTNQVLKKNSASDYDVGWGAPSAVADATTSGKGVGRVSAAPAQADDPVFVGDNDTRVPSQGENDALQGTSGAPSNTNRFVTNSDARLTRYGAFTFFASGDVNAKTGVGHDPATVACTVDEIWITCDTAPAGGTLTVTLVKEAGGPGGAATTIGSVTLAIGSRIGSTTGLSVAVARGDTVRADITTGGGYTAGSAKNLTAKARYS